MTATWHPLDRHIHYTRFENTLLPPPLPPGDPIYIACIPPSPLPPGPLPRCQVADASCQVAGQDPSRSAHEDVTPRFPGRSGVLVQAGNDSWCHVGGAALGVWGGLEGGAEETDCGRFQEGAGVEVQVDQVGAVQLHTLPPPITKKEPLTLLSLLTFWTIR